MEEKKQGFLGTYKCLILFAVMMVAAIAIVLVKPMMTGEEKYIGTGTSPIGGEVKVEVKIAKGEIKSVNVISHNETEGIGTNAVDQIPGAIVEKQNVDVDAVAGATLTSKAICEAVADAMTQAGLTPAEMVEPTAPASQNNGSAGASGPLSAGTYSATAKGMGDVTVTITVDDAGAITDVQIEGAGETAGIGTNAIEKLPNAILEAQSADVDGVAGATITSNAIKTALSDCLAQASSGTSAAEGTAYTATAKGMGDVTVTIIVNDAGAVVDVQIDGSGETPGIGTNAIEKLPAAILEAQSADVDVIAGATITSNAIKTALADCLAQAGK